MEAKVAKSRMARSLAAAAMVSAAAAVTFAWLQPSQGRVPATERDPAFCALAPDEARATPADRADVQFSATVPISNPAAWVVIDSVAASKGDVVRVSVAAPREGGVAVHGLMDQRPIHIGELITVEFRAIYSGRFPIHFHGADGSHLEIAAIEVRPTMVSTVDTISKKR